MSPNERRAIVSLLTTLLVAVFFLVYVLPRYPAGNPYSADVFHFWGLAVVIFIPVSIVANIAMSIVFSIVYFMATHEKDSSFSDERDRLIELRSLRNALYVFAGGFFLAMGSLVIGMPPSVMFIVLTASGFGSGVVAGLSQLYLYRKGF
jgi:hypothetical protein